MLKLKSLIRKRNKEADELTQAIERQLEKAGSDRIHKMARSVQKLEPDWDRSFEEDVAFVSQTSRARRALREVRVRKAGDLGEHLKFSVSSRFLRECATYLTADKSGHERLHLVSGIISEDGVRILSQIEKVSFDETTKSAAYVAADPVDTTKRLVSLERDGHELLGMWHSHIMRGEHSSQPSSVDMENQRRFIQMGSDAIGGIFTLDGYIRLFGTGKTFEVSVYGNGCKLVRAAPRETILKLEGFEA